MSFGSLEEKRVNIIIVGSGKVGYTPVSYTHLKDTESNCKQGRKDYNHMYTMWNNDQNGKDCQGIKDKVI